MKLLLRFIYVLLTISVTVSMAPPIPASAADRADVQGMSLIRELARKEYQGRQAGTQGYAQAVTLLEKQMISVGMSPLFGENQYRQMFDTGTALLTKEKVTVNGSTIKLQKDYMPFGRTASGASSYSKLYYVGTGTDKEYKGKTDGLVLFHWNDKNGKFPEGVLDRVQRAQQKGATAVLIIANGELKIGNYEHPLIQDQLSIPVLYISEETGAKLGVPTDFTFKILTGGKVGIDLTVTRQTAKADNLVGVIPGLKEDKAVLYVTNIDGFGSLPDGRWYESAKAGAAAAAMMMDLARYYREHKPAYTMIFAFVGGKWKGQEGVRALAEKLNFDHIAVTVDLYAMGGNGRSDQIWYNYSSPAFAAFAQAIVNNPRLNTDLGNALSSVLASKTDNLFLIRDQNTWVDDSMTDTASAISQKQYEDGVATLLAFTNRVMDRISEGDKADFPYEKSAPVKYTFPGTKTEVTRTESKHFTVYADQAFQKSVTVDVLKEMDAIYERVAMYNYYPRPRNKVNVLFLQDGNLAAKISGRKDLEGRDGQAGGGFAGEKDGEMYIYCRSGPTFETVAHELNHALASANPYAGSNFELQEWQGQSHFVRYQTVDGRSQYVQDTSALIKSSFFSHEVPKLKDIIANYKTALNWAWFTKAATNPAGHLHTYYTMGSMYAFLHEVYGEKLSRRAMYKNYEDVANIPHSLTAESELTTDEFLEAWSKWMLSAGTQITDRSIAAKSKQMEQNNGFDYKMLFTLPSGAKFPSGQGGNESSGLTQNGNVKYKLTLSSSDLTVDSVNIIRTRTGANIELGYTSKQSRFVSLFNPPNGDKIMKMLKNAISNGKGTATIPLTDNEIRTLLELPDFTMRLGEGEDFIYIPASEYAPLLGR